MKKKITAIFLCIALAATAIVGASLAYFTDTDNATNTFTVGNVQIDLIESQLHRSNASNSNVYLQTDSFNDKLIAADDYSEAHNWTGTYFSDDTIKADAANYEKYLAEQGKDMVPGRNVHKMPYVINTGKNNAYVRVRVLVPVSLFDLIDAGPSYWTTTAINSGEVVSTAVAQYLANEGKNDMLEKMGMERGIPLASNIATTEREGIKYFVFDFTYTKALAPKEMTFWNCWGNIRIPESATNDDLANVDSFNVIVEADAIQSEGFDNATDAFKAFDKQTGDKTAIAKRPAADATVVTPEGTD